MFSSRGGLLLLLLLVLLLFLWGGMCGGVVGNPLGCVSRKEMNTLGVACHCVIFLQHAKQARARERNCTTCTKQNAQQQKNNNSTNLPFSGSKLWWVRHAKIVVKIQHHKLQLGNSRNFGLCFLCVCVGPLLSPPKQTKKSTILFGFNTSHPRLPSPIASHHLHLHPASQFARGSDTANPASQNKETKPKTKKQKQNIEPCRRRV